MTKKQIKNNRNNNQNNNENNNKSFRLAVILLVLALITACFIGGTVAKYLTTGNGSDSANVAKWGVVVDLKGVDLFKAVYNDDAAKAVVQSAVDVVAPGTKGDLGTVSISGTPEVAGEITVKGTLELTNWTVKTSAELDAQAEDYCPLVFTVNSEKYYIGKNASITDVAGLKKAVEDAIGNLSIVFAPGTNLEGKLDANTISWEWEFTGTTVTGQTDAKDTLLGDAAATGTMPTIKLTLDVTVAQTATNNVTPAA